MKYIFCKFILLIITSLIFLIGADFNIENNIYKIPPKIVLVTIDGVRWQNIFDKYHSHEIIPNMYKYFVDNGMVIGRDSPALTANYAHVSQPGYTEIMTGAASLTCFDNNCPPNTKRTLINEFANDATVFSGWDTISKVFDNSLAIVNIGRSIRNQQWIKLNLPDNNVYPDIFEEEEYRADQYTQEAVTIYLKTQLQPNFLWVSFGDTDENAHANNMPAYLTSLHLADKFIGDIINMADPNTVFIICPDHGRNDLDWRNHGGDIGSGRVWIMMTGPGVPKQGFVKYYRKVYLSDIYPTIIELTKRTKTLRSLLNQ